MKRHLQIIYTLILFKMLDNDLQRRKHIHVYSVKVQNFHKNTERNKMDIF